MDARRHPDSWESFAEKHETESSFRSRGDRRALIGLAIVVVIVGVIATACGAWLRGAI